MSGSVCDVCGGESKGVFSSSLGAFSNAYCEDCAKMEIEPYGDLVAFGFSVSSDVEALHPAYRDMIKASLTFHGKTIEEWKADVEKAEKDFMDHMAREAGFEDFKDLEKNDKEVFEVDFFE